MIKPRLSLVVAAALAAIHAPGVLAQRTVNVPAGDRELSATATELFRVGAMAGDDWETFADVRSVAFDAAGNLYILDGDNHRVVVVDESGQLLRQLGKEGDGPGELRFPMGMVVAPDGSVAVADMGHQAFVMYDPSGEYVRNANNDFQSGLLGGRLDYHPRNGAVGVSQGRFRLNGATAEPGVPIRFVPFDEGAEIEELGRAWKAPEEEGGGGGGSFSSEGGALRISGMPKLLAFEPIMRTAVLPDGRIVLADSAAYNLKLLDPTGGISAVVKRGLEPRPVTKRDQRAETDRRREELENPEDGGGGSGGGGGGVIVMSVTGSGGGGGGQTMRMGGDQMQKMQLDRLETMVFADEMPVISNLAADKEGRIWVERTGDEVGEDGPTDVITASGDYLGTLPADGIRIPSAFGPEGLTAYIETDEFEVEYVVVRRVNGIDRR